MMDEDSIVLRTSLNIYRLPADIRKCSPDDRVKCDIGMKVKWETNAEMNRCLMKYLRLGLTH